MKHPAARLLTRVLALAFLLLSFFIVDAAILGVLPLVGLVALLPAAGLITLRLFALSVKPAPRRARISQSHGAPPPRRAARAALAPTKANLRVGAHARQPAARPPHAA